MCQNGKKRSNFAPEVSGIPIRLEKAKKKKARLAAFLLWRWHAFSSLFFSMAAIASPVYDVSEFDLAECIEVLKNESSIKESEGVEQGASPTSSILTRPRLQTC